MTRIEVDEQPRRGHGIRALALHTVERIIPAPMFSPLPVRGRVSVTLRVAG
jgi:hypothetical protein